MSVADKYPRSKYIKKLIENYTRDVIDWGAKYGRAKKQYGDNARLDKPYPYSEEAKQNLFDHFDALFREADKKDWADLNGHMLWYFADNIKNAFAKNMFEIFDYQIKNYPLTDNAKVNFLELLFSKDKENNISQVALEKIADYNPTCYQEITNRLFTKASIYLDNPRRVKKVGLIYMVFEKYAKNIEVVSDKVVLNCADLYFKLANRLDKPLSVKPLEMLLTKEAETLYNNAVGKEPYVNTRLVKELFETYIEFVKKNENIKPHLHFEMKDFGGKLMEYYTHDEVKDLINVLNLPKLSKMSKNYKDSIYKVDSMREEFEYLYNRAKKYKTWKERVDIKSPDFVANRNNVLNYANNLFNDASKNQYDDVKTDTLYQLLLSNAKVRGLDDPQVDIFGNVSRKNTIDKKLVKDVAAAYADFVEHTDMEVGYLNPDFHKNLTNMFKDIVTKYDYTPENVSELTETLAKGARGDRVFKSMAADVSSAYNSSKVVKTKAGRSL